jgi:hypothetical protein
MQQQSDADILIRRAVRQAVKAAGYPDSPDTLLTREATASALTAAGYPVATRTLATKATRGGGPAYSLFGGRALYRWGDALDWARSLTTPRTSTSERDAQRGGV